jgi:beta-lactamase regulating signal transducer with metallopeptidase domain
MLPFILEAAMRSLALGLAIGLGLKVLRLANPHIEMAVWRSVLAASLLMPFMIGWATFPVTSPNLPIPEALPTDMAAFFTAFSPPTIPAAAAAAPIVQMDWRATATLLYFCVAAFLVLRLFVGAALTWRLCRSATPICEDWTAGRDVRASPRVDVPMTFGSIVVLPENYAGWDATQRRAVMAHEISHVSAYDFYVLFLAAINRAVFWFSPLGWWLNYRLANLAEARSDAAAIADVNDRVRYAEILLGFGSTTSRAMTALAMARTATVCRRVEHILAETMLPDKMSWKTWSLLGACVLPLVVVSVGAVAQAPATQQSRNAATPAPASDQELLRQRLEEQKRPRKQVPIAPAILDNYIGYYHLGGYQVLSVTRQNDQLFVQLAGEDKVPVYPESAQKFFYKSMPAQISFVTDSQGRATALILHRDGVERPAPRLDQAQAQKLQEDFAKRLKGEAPLPGSEAALRGQIESFEQGHPDLGAMTDHLATVTRPQVPKIEREFALLGPLQSLSFQGVGFSGWDIYEAKFTGGIMISRILLTPDAKISGLLFQWGP